MKDARSPKLVGLARGLLGWRKRQRTHLVIKLGAVLVAHDHDFSSLEPPQLGRICTFIGDSFVVDDVLSSRRRSPMIGAWMEFGSTCRTFAKLGRYVESQMV